MAKSKKEKKLARRERQEQLHKAAVRVQEKLLTEMLEADEDEEEEVQYVLSEEEEEVQTNARVATPEAPSADATAPSKPAANKAVAEEVEDEDRVKLPSMAATGVKTAAAAGSAAALAGRKHHRIPWEQLKVMVVERFGPEASKMVSEHDGNAEDPFFTVQLNMQRGSVPVPRHWNKLRTFLSLQSDREEAINVVPSSIHALGIHKARATKQKHQAPDQKAVVACFMTGTPLQHHDFNVPLTRHGEVFYEGKWLPKTKYVPGELSERLQKALGIHGASPPPWLYSMQTMRRLPPAYPAIRLPGLNAPIPPGAQWGRGQGQWGEPPRGEGNAFLFPSVMGERAGAADPNSGWGRVPSLHTDRTSTTTAATAAEAAAATPPPAPTAAAAPPQTAPTRPAVTPTPFQPKSFVPHDVRPPGDRYGPSAPREYVRVQDGGVGSVVAVGHTYVQRGATPSAVGRRRPAPPAAPLGAKGGKQQAPPRASPAPPPTKPNPPPSSGTTRF